MAPGPTMTDAEYRQVRPGAVVRLRRPMQNSVTVLPAGTEMTVTYKRSGLYLTGPKCDHCGVQARITRVEAHTVDLVRHA